MTATHVKATLLGVLDAVADGEEIEITRHGSTVARLVPARGPNALRARYAGVTTSSAEDEDLFTTGATWELA